MDELVQQVAQKTGISAEQARTAVETVVNFIKGRLPAAIAPHVDTAVGAAGKVDLGSVASGLGGLFGKK